MGRVLKCVLVYWWSWRDDVRLTRCENKRKRRRGRRNKYEEASIVIRFLCLVTE